MLPKKKRLTTSLFDQVFKFGKVQHSRSFWVRSLVSLENQSVVSNGLYGRFAVAVPKKLASTAVLRNRIKKIIYRAVETLEKGVLVDKFSYMVIFGVKSDISKVPFSVITQEIKELLLSRSRGSTAVVALSGANYC